MRIVLFGSPGAGKGTQAKLLMEQLEVTHIGSGDLFRQNLQNETPLGLRAANYLNQGLLVPDEVTIDMILERVLSLQKEEGFILDGFPRNQNQAEVLEEALERRSRKLDKVVFIDVPESELVRRLGQRFSCRQCQAPHTLDDRKAAIGQRCRHCGGELYQRVDDQPEPVQRRVRIYQAETLPLLDFYRERGLLANIPGVGSVEEVNKHVLEALGRVSKAAERE
ncbi:MAG: adenylate kinase [SAR202 cluster bacterium Io17-Chloro-G9]|nr:MAG: adenylate kinase [SAR202 cluster bacterium Io17-Chloro-G9]